MSQGLFLYSTWVQHKDICPERGSFHLSRQHFPKATCTDSAAMVITLPDSTNAQELNICELLASSSMSRTEKELASVAALEKP